jgi:hypothetical protein
MKNKYVLGGVVLLLMFTASATGQGLIAGSDEDKLFQQITATADISEKTRLCLEFEQQFPDSGVLDSIYTILMDLHTQQAETDKALEYGEKIIAIDENNVNALMAVARGYAILRRNMTTARQYAERAVNASLALADQLPPPGYTEEQWQTYVNATVGAARSILDYVRTIG